MSPKIKKVLNALPMLSLFAWGAVTAFPTSEEKGEIIASQREEAAINAALGQMMTDTGGGGAHSDVEAPPLITAEDFRRGFVLTQTLTNEVHDFSVPEGAIVCEKWRRRGANEDAFVLADTDEAPWMFPFGTSVFSRVRVYSSGVVKPIGADGVIEVFKANLGIVPEANWRRIVRSQELGVSSQGQELTPNSYPLTPISCFWHHLTISNTLQLTWQNVLFNREADLPISFQVEFFENGNFIYRYDLSSIGSNLTSRSFHRLDLNDVPLSDNDKDGISLEDELFVYRTNPNLADSDGDGVSDYDEITAGSNPLAQSRSDSEILDRLVASQTNEVFFSPNVAVPDLVVSWKLFDNFSMGFTACDTNIVWERTFALNRTSAWQQFFISGSSSTAAPWRLSGMVLEWESNDGLSGAVTASPLCDSYRLPLPANATPSTLCLRLRRTGNNFASASSPIHLISYAPEIKIGGGSLITGKSGAKFYVFTQGSDSEISLKVDHSNRPCKAPIGADETDMSVLHNIGGDFAFSGDMNEGRVSAARPGMYQLPDISIKSQAVGRSASGGANVIVLSPSAGWKCENHGCSYDGLGYDWGEDVYYEQDSYPLDSKCLRKKWYRNYRGGWNHDTCEFTVSSGLGEENSYVTTKIDQDKNRGYVLVDGVSVWSGTAEHIYDIVSCDENNTELDECDTCESDCADGNCDSSEGSSLGSLKFRIPLGTPVKEQFSGFLWFATESPMLVGRSSFQLLSHPSAIISDTTSSGIRRIVCSDSRGRDLRIEDIANGVRIVIYETQAQKLEHTWEITNVDGDDKRIRLRKISRLNNVMSDETYIYYDGDWTRQDNISGLTTELFTENDFVDYGDGVKREARTTYDANGVMVNYTYTEHSRIGECDNALLRETYREESTGWNWKWTEADYWDDPSSSRHGLLRLVKSNARAWEYRDYDALGHKTLEVRQRGNAETPSVFPYVETNTLFDVQGIENAFVTVYDYTPFDGDSRHSDDAAKARQETRYIVVNGVPTNIGHTSTRYTRLMQSGYEAIKKETWRASENSLTPSPPHSLTSTSYSYEITYAEAGEDTPLLMRGAVVESLDENGVLTKNTYSLTSSVLAQISRKSFNGTPYQTYTVIEQDAAYGTVLRRSERLTANDVIISDEQSTYDEKNRLRSTTYLDGTFTTNAYSCCRLLWRQTREGRKTLRSAKTGTDHLYNAEEDVWLADVSTNGQYRVTQHFFDGLGRKTNTVVCVGMVPGEAVESDFIKHRDTKTQSESVSEPLSLCFKTEYPYGGSDYSIRTDERGKVTILQTDILGDAIESIETIFTNDIEVITTKNRTYLGGGSSIRREWSGNKWTEERRFTDYAADGKRIDYVVTESSDCGVVTNSVSTYDLLGRLVTRETALGTVTYHYNGISHRMTGQTFVAGNITRESVFLYDDCGNQVGVLQDGITTRADTFYETDASNIIWRVTTERTFGVGTNVCTVTRERLTMLSNECRSCIVKNDLSGAWQRLIKTFDASSGVETETVQSSTGETLSTIRKNGIAIETITSAKRTCNEYDALGRVSFVSHITKDGVIRPYQAYDYDLNGDLLATRTYTNATEVVTESYAYDKLGKRTETTDALGNTIFRSFNPFGNVIFEWGATYSVRYTYDAQNRRTSLATTRDGITWDETRWIYDAATGLCTSKIYADGSTVVYTYTPDGLLLRETKSEGTWKEYIYNAKRQIIGFVSSDGTQDAIIERDEFGRAVSESNPVANSLCSLDNQFGATNQMDNVDGVSASFVREFDQNGRLVRFERVGGETAQYVYATHDSISEVSNSEVAVHYSYSDDLLNAGYRIAIQGGSDFIRENYRDVYCRDNILAITNRHGGTIRGINYLYDALQRPVLRNDDEFGYNERGEVVFSRRDAEDAENTYLYDGIGNINLHEIVGVGTNSFSVNNRNQYLTIYENSVLSASLRETNLKYDSNGNLTKFGDWLYVYDSGSRLVSVSSNNTLVAAFTYDTQGRRVKKITDDRIHRYFYDGQLIVYEHITRPDNTVSEIDYVWGKDISGTRDGACGIGGLLYLKRNGVVYIPFYDAYGNVLGYTDAQGNVVAEYAYDAFGVLVCKSGAMSDDFAFRFSTKYYDVETDLYYYIYRYYKPNLMRWLSEDPIAEDGGLNLYGFCGNNPVCRYDKDGRAYFAVRGLGPIPTPLKWSDFMSGLRSAMCPFASLTQQERDAIDKAADLSNFEILHEQLFFEDGGDINSIGWGNENGGRYMYNENPDRYTKTNVGYDDCIMRLAVAEVSPTHYQLSWIGRKSKCNCQDYADALRKKYHELQNDQKIKCKCKKEI